MLLGRSKYCGNNDSTSMDWATLVCVVVIGIEAGVGVRPVADAVNVKEAGYTPLEELAAKLLKVASPLEEVAWLEAPEERLIPADGATVIGMLFEAVLP